MVGKSTNCNINQMKTQVLMGTVLLSRLNLLASLLHPQHLKLLLQSSDMNRHLITFAFTQHGPT